MQHLTATKNVVSGFTAPSSPMDEPGWPRLWKYTGRYGINAPRLA